MSAIRISLLLLELAATTLGCNRATPVGLEPGVPDPSPGDGSILATVADMKMDLGEKKPKGKFTIGKETTYVTGPLYKYGYINYQAALNERLRRGATPENNACVLLWKAIGPHPQWSRINKGHFEALGMQAPPEKGDYYVDFSSYVKRELKIQGKERIEQLENHLNRAGKRPWSANEHPQVAAWLKANENPLAIIIEATKRTHYFSPSTSSGDLLGKYMPESTACREWGKALVARAMLRVNDGRIDEAWQDLLACHRLGRLCGGGGTLIECLLSFAIETMASNADLAFLERADVDAKRVRGCLRDLQALSPLPQPADAVDLAERFSFLEEIMLIDRHGIPYLERLSTVGPEKAPTELQKHLLDDVDWDQGLRNANRWYDRIVAAMRQNEYSMRAKQLEQIHGDLKAMKKRLLERDLIKLLGDAKNKGEVVCDLSFLLLIPSATKVQEAADRVEQSKRNLHIAFALAAYQRENGRYPPTLDALTPKYLAKIPNDLFTGAPLIYRPSEKGFLLYSVGPNGKDDEGCGTDDDPKGDDLAIRMPPPKPKN